LTGEDSPKYPEVYYGIEPESTPEPVDNRIDDFIFIPPDITPRSFYGPAVIDNYDPSIQEIGQNITPDIIEDYDPRVDQEA
jgi:hypothetical protein